MWEDFQKALEKRINNNKIIKNDKYLITSTSETVLIELFGEISRKFTKVKDYKEGQLWLELKNSTWKNEFKLNEKIIIEKINKKLNEVLIKKIIITQ